MQANPIAAASRAEAYVLAAHAPVRSSRMAAWFTPDMALVAAVVAVIYLIAEFGGVTALFRDADAGWHIRTGERIVATGALPHADPFSFSRPGAEWFAWEWTIDLMSGALHRALGLAGVAWFYALAIGVSIWMSFRLAWKAGGNFLLVCAFAAPMLSTVNLHWLARPHVVSWVFLLAAVWFCERASSDRRAGGASGLFSKAWASWQAEAPAPRLLSDCEGMLGVGQALSPAAEPSWRDLLTAFFFAAAWANVHGSFFFAVLIPLVYAAGAWLSGLIWEPETHPAAFLQLSVAAAAGTLVNPLGWRLHEHVVGYLTNRDLLDRIGEFQSFNFHADGAAQIVLALLLGLIGGVAALAIRRIDRFLLSLVLTAGALRTARLLPVAALLLLPLAAGSITSALRSAQVGRRFRKRVAAFLAYGDGLRQLDGRRHGAALTPLLAIALLGVLKSSHPAFPADQFPVAASARVETLPADARIFSSDKFGGYLIYRFAGTRKVFFDGRSDFYGAEFLRQYARINQVRPGWRPQFDAWNFTHALVSPQAPLAEALQSAGWRELYRDKVAVLFERGGLS